MSATCIQALKRASAAGHEVASKTREMGFLGMIRHVVGKIIQEWRNPSTNAGRADAFDLKYGTDTARSVGVWALDIPRSQRDHASRYETIDPERLAENFGTLDIPHKDFVFIDLGSGKGRALLVASRFPFKEIIGVELAASLSEVANRNIAIFHDASQQCHKMRSICLDVTDFQFPEENVLLYLFNPFDEHVMENVVSKMEDFIRRTSKQVYVLYHHPAHKSVWDKSGAFEAITNHEWFTVYRSTK